VKHLMQIEPVMVSQLLAAVFTLLVAFGVPMTPEQRAAVMQVVAAVLPILVATGLLARSKAYAPATVERIVAEKDAEIAAAAPAQG